MIASLERKASPFSGRCRAKDALLPRRKPLCGGMKKTSPNAIEDARQRVMTIRLLFVIGALAGLLACVLASRLL
jgi:hypothetical protein